MFGASRRRGKRTASPVTPPNSVGKRKRNTTPLVEPKNGGGGEQGDSATTSRTTTPTSVANSDSNAGGVGGCDEIGTDSSLVTFKDTSFTHSGKGGSNRKRVWRNLKQIITAERALPWKPDDPTYSSIDAPPSLKPSKKYSDLSGLPANYTDPHTKIRYMGGEEFSLIRVLPLDIANGYLALRKANTPVP